MLETDGVVVAGYEFNQRNLKKNVLLFNKIVALDLDEFLARRAPVQPSDDWKRNIEYLLERKILCSGELRQAPGLNSINVEDRPELEFMGSVFSRAGQITTVDTAMSDMTAMFTLAQDRSLRLSVSEMLKPDVECAPIYQSPLTAIFRRQQRPKNGVAFATTDLLSLGLDFLPIPDQSCSWNDILDFKEESRDKQWAFHRFLRSLSTKKQTEAEIRDDIEWSINEYRKAMEAFNLKSRRSFVEVALVTPLDIIENLCKLNFSKLIGGTLALNKRKAELLDAEMKAPGRECAYAFDAQQRFGQPA